MTRLKLFPQYRTLGLSVCILGLVVVSALVLNQESVNTKLVKVLNQESANTELVKVVNQESANTELVKVLNQESANTELVSVLTESLDKKLRHAASTKSLKISSLTCQQLNITNYVESTNCLRQTLPEDLALRVQTLTSIHNIPISQEISQVLQEMSSGVKGHHEIILVTAASMGHFREAQGLLKNLHDVVFPVFPKIKLVFYDIGLTREQRLQLENHCRCTVVTFPFPKLPSHVNNLKCYSWKVISIAAHYEQAEVLVWLDSSIRILNATSFATMVQRTKHRGVQQRCNMQYKNIQFTLPQMFEVFGDSPCAHDEVPQVGATFGMYHREDLIRHAVIRPWLGCAVNQFCICPVDPRNTNGCMDFRPRLIGVCHRWEQSALSIILARLFRDKYFHVAVDVTWFVSVKRGEKVDYFEQLEET